MDEQERYQPSTIKEYLVPNEYVAYCIGSYYSNAWLSDNPNSGVYEADKAKTLDNMNCGYPACNQGGVAVVEIYQPRKPSE